VCVTSDRTTKWPLIIGGMSDLSSVTDPDNFGTDLDPTFEKNPDPDQTSEKMRIQILPYVKILYKLFEQ
jgi:hypothetical protein